MIWSSVLAMTILDLIIIGLVLAMFAATWSLGMFEKGRKSRAGRFLVMIGVSLTGLFYLTDLFIMHALPAFLTRSEAMSVMQTLHLDVRWIVSLLSLFLMSLGIVIDAYQRHVVEGEMRETDKQIAAARDQIIQSEIRFRSLAEQTPDPVYCFELHSPISVDSSKDQQIERIRQAVLVECNTEFAETCGRKSPEQILGIEFGELTAARDAGLYDRLVTDLIENDYRLSGYEFEYSLPNVGSRAIRTSVTGVIDDDGRLVRFWGAEKNILEEKKTKAALQNRLDFQALIAELSMALLTVGDDTADAVIHECLERVARRSEVDRAGIVWLDAETRTAEELYVWNELGLDPLVQRSATDFAFLAPKLKNGETVRVDTLDEIPATAKKELSMLRELGVRSFVVVPLIVAGQTYGACAFSTVIDERHWTDQDIADLQAFSHLFATTVLRLRSHRKLEQVAAELLEAKSRLEAENVYLREEIGTTHSFDEIIGESEVLVDCLRQVARVAKTSTAVLLQGETGTGKELIARAIHQRSQRRDRPLVKVNCAALPANLIESELFGHEKGAFTGALSQKRGRFDLADGGTLFLDEVADLPLDLQSKLLRVLQNGEFERLGGHETRKVDVRIIAATNRDLKEAVDHGDFRSDLYYRICTFPIALPPLRERGGDITLLTQHFVQKHANRLGKRITEISAPMISQLQKYEWPGNVRELEGIVQRAIISSNGPILRLPGPLRGVADSQTGRPVAVELDLRTNEREHIRRVLEQTGWQVTGDAGAATKLGVPPSTLRSKMKKLGIIRPY